MTVQILCARAGAAALLLLAGASAAAAQQPQSNQMMMSSSVRQACASDLNKLCPSVQPGGGRQMQCLHENSAKVSSKCKDALQTAKAAEETKKAPQ